MSVDRRDFLKGATALLASLRVKHIEGASASAPTAVVSTASTTSAVSAAITETRAPTLVESILDAFIGQQTTSDNLAAFCESESDRVVKYVAEKGGDWSALADVLPDTLRVLADIDAQAEEAECNLRNIEKDKAMSLFRGLERRENFLNEKRSFLGRFQYPDQPGFPIKSQLQPGIDAYCRHIDGEIAKIETELGVDYITDKKRVEILQPIVQRILSGSHMQGANAEQFIGSLEKKLLLSAGETYQEQRFLFTEIEAQLRNGLHCLIGGSKIPNRILLHETTSVSPQRAYKVPFILDGLGIPEMRERYDRRQSIETVGHVLSHLFDYHMRHTDPDLRNRLVGKEVLEGSLPYYEMPLPVRICGPLTESDHTALVDLAFDLVTSRMKQDGLIGPTVDSKTLPVPQQRMVWSFEQGLRNEIQYGSDSIRTTAQSYWKRWVNHSDDKKALSSDVNIEQYRKKFSDSVKLIEPEKLPYTHVLENNAFKNRVMAVDALTL